MERLDFPVGEGPNRIKDLYHLLNGRSCENYTFGCLDLGF